MATTLDVVLGKTMIFCGIFQKFDFVKLVPYDWGLPRLSRLPTKMPFCRPDEGSEEVVW
jgi:hypothetical protein